MLCPKCAWLGNYFQANHLTFTELIVIGLYYIPAKFPLHDKNGNYNVAYSKPIPQFTNWNGSICPNCHNLRLSEV